MAERGGEDQGWPNDEPPTTTDNNNKRKLDEIQLAKQKAQEIVARLVNSAESKRPRVDDLSENTSGSYPPQFPTYPDVAPKPASQLAANSQVGSTPYPVQPAASYGQSTSKQIRIPNGKVGVIIGKGGETIKYLQHQSGARIQITKDTDADLLSQTRDVTLSGTPEQVSRAEQLINDVIAETDAGGSAPTTGHGLSSLPHGVEQFTMKIPNDKVALMIGKGGETIKNMQSRSGARIQIIPLHLPPGDMSTERTVYINGSKEQIESAKELVNDVITGNRARLLSNPSNYTQQGYRPPANWGQPPMQQPGYGYAQPGTYSAPPPPYYSNYPPQATGWDQSNPSAVPPPPQPNTGYNYYGQPVQTETGSAQVDASYGYGQAPPVATQNNDQGYAQQHTYGQDTTSQVPPQDQQKLYTTPGYGPPAAPSQLEGTPYGTQPSTQPPAYPVAYSQPPTVSPGTYSQPPSVPPVTYSQPPTVPPATYSHPPAYGPPSGYGAPLATQPGYDQTGAGYNQSGYGVQQSPQIPPSTAQPVYAQGGYPSQPPSAQSSYVQGTNPSGYAQQQPASQPATYTEQ